MDPCQRRPSQARLRTRRSHISFLKGVALRPGRDVQLSVRVTFSFWDRQAGGVFPAARRRQQQQQRRDRVPEPALAPVAAGGHDHGASYDREGYGGRAAAARLGYGQHAGSEHRD